VEIGGDDDSRGFTNQAVPPGQPFLTVRATSEASEGIIARLRGFAQIEVRVVLTSTPRRLPPPPGACVRMRRQLPFVLVHLGLSGVHLRRKPSRFRQRAKRRGIEGG
jgi:hypothetical protein